MTTIPADKDGFLIGQPLDGQDVRDRTIAHIASGGIGGPVFHR